MIIKETLPNFNKKHMIKYKKADSLFGESRKNNVGLVIRKQISINIFN